MNNIRPDRLSRPLASRITGLPTLSRRIDEPELAPSVMDAAIKALNRGETHYTDRPRIVGLQTWATESMEKTYGLELQTGEVTIKCGVTEGRFVVIKQLSTLGSQIVCPEDAAVIGGAAHLADVSVVQLVNEPFAVSMIYIRPQDKHGVVDEVLRQAAEHDWLIVWDISAGVGDSNFHPA